MNETELLAILARGEDSRHQFKENISNVDSLAALASSARMTAMQYWKSSVAQSPKRWAPGSTRGSEKAV